MNSNDPMLSTIAVLACLASTLYMTGVIWFVQRVHYPLLGEVGPGSFGRYHAEHVRRTGPVVFFAMTAELIGAAVIAAGPPSGCPRWLAIAGLLAAVATWVSTAFVQVPMHRRLADGFDPATHRALVRSNAARTAAWTAHALIILAIAGLAMR